MRCESGYLKCLKDLSLSITLIKQNIFIRIINVFIGIKVFDPKNSIDWLLIEKSDLNYNKENLSNKKFLL